MGGSEPKTMREEPVTVRALTWFGSECPPGTTFDVLPGDAAILARRRQAELVVLEATEEPAASAPTPQTDAPSE